MKQSHILLGLLAAATLITVLSPVALAQLESRMSNSNLNYRDTESTSPVMLPDLQENKPVEKKVQKAKKEASAKTVVPIKKTEAVTTAGEGSKEQRELKRIEHYLNSINTLVADFTQVAPDGSIASGKFYLKRPGKMRWQYEPPTPVLIIANNGSLVYYDYELKQVTHLPIDSSLASILARKHIRLDDPDLVIEELIMNSKVINTREEVAQVATISAQEIEV